MIARRVLARYLAAGQLPLTHLDDSRVWPEVKDFRVDAVGQGGGYVYEAEYEYLDKSPFLRVTFAYEGDEPAPGTWSSRVNNRELKGTWSNEREIPGILAKLLDQARASEDEIAKAVRGVGGPSWDAHLDDDVLTLSFKNPDRFSDASMVVIFDYLVDALNGGREEAKILFSAGSDYQGHHGERDETRPYSSVADMQKVLRAAERLWVKWSNG